MDWKPLHLKMDLMELSSTTEYAGENFFKLVIVYYPICLIVGVIFTFLFSPILGNANFLYIFFKILFFAAC